MDSYQSTGVQLCMSYKERRKQKDVQVGSLVKKKRRGQF